MDEVTMDVAEFERLSEVDAFMDCLRAAGVDNWEGYYEARRMMNEAEEDEE